MKSLPSWPNRVAAAHTVVREVRTHDAYRFRPEGFSSLTVPALLLAGSESLPSDVKSTALLAASLPRARVVTMPGQGHVAMLTAPELFAAEVLGFRRNEAF